MYSRLVSAHLMGSGRKASAEGNTQICNNFNWLLITMLIRQGSGQLQTAKMMTTTTTAL
jgi:hypothetical protein